MTWDQNTCWSLLHLTTPGWKHYTHTLDCACAVISILGNKRRVCPGVILLFTRHRSHWSHWPRQTITSDQGWHHICYYHLLIKLITTIIATHWPIITIIDSLPIIYWSSYQFSYFITVSDKFMPDKNVSFNKELGIMKFDRCGKCNMLYFN